MFRVMFGSNYILVGRAMTTRWWVLKQRDHYFKGFSPKNGKPTWTPDVNKALHLGRISAERQREHLPRFNTISIVPVTTNLGKIT